MKKKPKDTKKRSYRNLTARDGVIYYQRRTGKRRTRLSTKTDDWDVAAAFRDAYEQKHGQRPAGFFAAEEAVPTFADCAARALESMQDLAPTTQSDRTAMLRPNGPLVSYFGKMRIDTIRRAQLRDWWQTAIVNKDRTSRRMPKNGEPAPAARNGLSPKTGRNYLDALSAVFYEAVESEWIEESPVDAFRTALGRRRSRTKRGRADSEPGRNVRPLPTPEAVDAFVAAALVAGGHEATLDLLMLDAGLRIGEALGLRWEDVEWDRKVEEAGQLVERPALHICQSLSRGKHLGTTKSGRERRVALSRRLRARLREDWMRAGQPAAGRVLPPIDSFGYRKRHFRKVCRAAGIGEQWSPKDLRDTFASQLLTAGVQLGYISKQLGHAGVAVTSQHYAKWAGGDEYRAPLALRPGEVPADLLARLGRAVVAGEGAEAKPRGPY
jgi:integrase